MKDTFAHLYRPPLTRLHFNV